MSTGDKPILLFDGFCNLCNSSVQFFLKHEKTNDFRFTSLQSDTGKALLKKYNIDPKVTDSLVLIHNNKAYIKSSAALKATAYMKGLYPLLQAFLIIPAFIRNSVYDFIARNRYKWYGKSESCMIPDPSLTQRFI